jgi:phosphatidylserine/phosphatidylglycerophosphate/cardiolipin synthase-like enzyme
MRSLTTIGEHVVRRLSSRSSHCATLFDVWAGLRAETSVDARGLTAMAGLSAADEQGAYEMLQELSSLGLIVPAGRQWLARADFHAELSALSVAFAAIDYYKRDVHRDATEARVVLTQPVHSTTLAARLTEHGWKVSAIEPTHQAFVGLVQRATKRLVIMTPFLDPAGAGWLSELLACTRVGVSVTLVLRSLEDRTKPDYPTGYETIRIMLAERGVEVFNYSIPREDGRRRETFHAKVVLVDHDTAYVGSANLTRQYSMEMGIVVYGRAAAEVASVVDAVISAAEPYSP